MGRQNQLLLAPTMRSAPTGPIALGNIIKNPRSPEIPISDINSAVIKRIAANYTKVDESNVLSDTGGKVSSNAEAAVKFVKNLAAGFDFGASHQENAYSRLKIDRLSARSICPSKAEVKSVFDEPSVQEEIRNTFFTHRVYMITRVLIGYGAHDFISFVREHGAHLHAVADLNTAGLPVTAGIGGSVDGTDSMVQRSTINPSTPFVFAYGLTEIYYKRKRIVKQKTYKHGDLYSVRSREAAPVAEEDDPKNSVAEFEFLVEDNSGIVSMWKFEPSQYVLEGDD